MSNGNSQPSSSDRDDDLKIDRSYVPPGRIVETKLFVNPSPFEYSITIGFWVILGLLSQPELFISVLPINSSIYMQIYGEGNPFLNAIFGFLVINIGLTAMVGYLGIDAEIPTTDLIKWVLLTPFFGFSALQPFVKICYKRKQMMDANNPIG